MYGSGKQTQSFQYVSDLVNGLVELMESNDDRPRPVNIGNQAEMSINDLAATIRDMVDSTSEIVHLPAREDDPQRERPELGFEPTVPLDIGLAKTIEYFRNELDRSKHEQRNKTVDPKDYRL